MTAGKLPDPILVTHPRELKSLAQRLSNEPILAVDTESNSLYAYREQVCLIQFSIDQTDYLVDPLTLKDLTPLEPVFCDPKIEKVFHAAEYDLICLSRDFGFTFANLFDTMAAARILGRKAVGLGSMLETEFGVKVNKKHQRANWGQRPLPAHLLDYASLDTHYLIPLRDQLKAELRQRDLLPLAKEDFQRLIELNNHVDGSPTTEKHVDPWRVSGSHDLHPQQAAVLEELCRYRDQQAEARNQPLFKVINDKTLLAIAEETPRNLGELSRLPGMSQRQVSRHGARLLEAVERGVRAKPIYPARSPRPDSAFLGRLEALREWRKRRAREMGVPSDVALPRDLMFRLAKEAPSNEQQLARTLREVPWRLEHFGKQILEALSTRKS